MSAWVLPDHIADVLPAQARLIEDYRRTLLDTARSYGYELVIPPLVEHIDSLLSGTGEALDLQTFKMVDLLSGRTLGVRADTTQQVARIDAHRRFHAAVEHVGPGLADICWRVICAGEGIGGAEKALGWPSRSGKLVLTLALDRLARFYGTG